jgi:hypothetical protein
MYLKTLRKRRYKINSLLFVPNFLSSFIFSNLGGQVESQASQFGDSVFNNKGGVSGHGQDNLGGQVGGFIEKVQVSEGEGQGDGFIDFEDGVFFLLFRFISLYSDASSTDFTGNGESDGFFGGFNSDCFGNLGHFSADSGEFSSTHSDDGVVVSFGDAELFTVDGQQVEVEFRDLVSLGIFKDKSHGRRIFFGLHGDNIVITSALHDLGEVLDVETQSHVLEGSEAGETVFLEVQSDKGNVGGIHSLDGETSRRDVDVDSADQFLDGFNDLLEDDTLFEFSLEHVLR